MPFRKTVFKWTILTLFGISAIAHGYADEEPKKAPLNPQFRQKDEYLVRMLSEAPYSLGYRAGPVLPEVHQPLEKLVKATVSDPKYDLRDPDLDGDESDSLLTPVKNQSTCGCCWAFATYGSLESHLKGPDTTSYDFSEDNLKHRHGGDWEPCEGGNSLLSSAYLARFFGPISETDDPYDPSPTSPYCETCDPILFSDNHVFLPGRAGSTDNNYIKQAILDYGAIATNFYWNAGYYDSSDYTYYYDGSSDPNHAVAIVGWDDDKVVPGAPGNGAFIIKNSWGTNWGEEGYFYLSYHDAQTAKGFSVAFRGSEDSDSTFNRIYQHDPLGWVSGLGCGDGDDWAANIFTPTANGILAAVGVYLTSSSTAYEIYVYDDFNGSQFSNLLTSQTGSQAYGGWYSIHLDSPVRIKKGDSFGVVVRYNNGGTHAYPIAFEEAISGYSSAAAANAGESFYSCSGVTFTDITSSYPTANVCIKAFVREPRSLSDVFLLLLD